FRFPRFSGFLRRLFRLPTREQREQRKAAEWLVSLERNALDALARRISETYRRDPRAAEVFLGRLLEELVSRPAGPAAAGTFPLRPAPPVGNLARAQAVLGVLHARTPRISSDGHRSRPRLEDVQRRAY